MPNIATPSGILFFKKAVSVIYKIFAFSSNFNITFGAKIKRIPNSAEIIPIMKIVIRKVSKFLPEVSYRLIESFLLVGLFSEALSEKMYMRKKFPNSSWTVEAASLIDKSGLN